MPGRTRTHGFRLGQIGSASMVSLAHGTNDAQKTMGIITLALIANGTLNAGAEAPFWVIVSCALAISLGTYMGGWRVIRTLGKGLVEIESPQGMAAESSSAAVILLSSHFGYSLSTTHVATGSILGTGVGKKGAEVRWNVAGRMATAWLLTLPAAGVVGACRYALANGIGGDAGVLVVLAVLVAIAVVHLPAVAAAPPSATTTSTRNGPGRSHRPNPTAGRAGSARRPNDERLDRSDGAVRRSSSVGLICGAGLPALFAVGLQALHAGSGPCRRRLGRLVGGNPAAIAAACGVLRRGAGRGRLGYLLDRQHLSGREETRGIAAVPVVDRRLASCRLPGGRAAAATTSRCSRCSRVSSPTTS